MDNDRHAHEAQATANAVASAFMEQVHSLMKVENMGRGRSGRGSYR